MFAPTINSIDLRTKLRLHANPVGGKKTQAVMVARIWKFEPIYDPFQPLRRLSVSFKSVRRIMVLFVGATIGRPRVDQRTDLKIRPRLFAFPSHAKTTRFGTIFQSCVLFGQFFARKGIFALDNHLKVWHNENEKNENDTFEKESWQCVRRCT